MDVRPATRVVIAGGASTLALIALAGCGSSSNSAPSTDSSIPTALPTQSASVSGSASREDTCAQPNADLVAQTFMSSLTFAGPETYMQCVYRDEVSEATAAQIKALNITDTDPVIDANTNTYTYSAPDGKKVTLSLTKLTNSNYYVTNVKIT